MKKALSLILVLVMLVGMLPQITLFSDAAEACSEHNYVGGVCASCGNSVLGSDWIVPEFAEGDYSMVVLPDTQNMVDYWPEFYYKQMQWIADNKDTLNIQAVLHMGDMVNTNNDTQWTVCEKGTDILENAGIPWMPMMGNHDNSTWFNQYYDYATYGTEKSWFGGSYHDGKLDHAYWFVTVGNREYMILSLGWAPSWDVLAWAQDIVEANTDKNVIINCHAYMNSDGTFLGTGDAHCVSSYLSGYPNGDDVWKAFQDYENVVLAMGGHIHSEDVVTYTDKNGIGRDVTSLLFDRQNDDTQKHYGMIALLTFHEDSNTVEINWYSTRYDALYREKNQFSISVPHLCDHVFEISATEPTCTQPGGKVYTCTVCGGIYTEGEIAALGHDYNAVVTPPTCTTEGYTTLTCTTCGHTELKLQETDITDAFVWNEGYVISATHGAMSADKNWVASDYVDISAYSSIEIVTGDTINAGTTLGIAFYDANKKYIGGVVHTDKQGTEYGILVHDLDVPENAVYLRTTWYSVNHDKYDGATLHTFYCKGYCTEIPALGHSYSETVTPPTCTTEGYTTLTCNRCGDTKVETTTVDITELFTWTEGTMIIATTGNQTSFSVWQSSDYVDISAYTALEILTANTASTGTTTGFAFYDADKNYICGVKHTDGSGVYGVLVHHIEIPEDAVYIRSTWYSMNHPNYNSDWGEFYCKGIYEITEPASGHAYKSTYTAPTCVEQGYTTYTCDCGDSYVDDYVNALGHTAGESVVENETADGYDSVTYCTVCGEELSREYVETSAYIPGDINGDGIVNNRDAARLLQYLAGWDVEVVEAALDANGDGNINNRDAARILQYLAGWDVELH